MKLTKSLLVIAALGMLTESAIASIEPYVGCVYEWTTTSHNKHRQGLSGDRMFDKNYGIDRANIYFGGTCAFIGARWKDISIEAGHEATGQKEKNGSHSDTSKEGEVITASVRAKHYLKGWHLDVNAYLPVKDDFELISSLGYGAIKNKVSGNLMLAASNEFVLAEELRSSNRYRNTLRLGIGAQQMLCNHVGIRAMVRYKILNNQSRLKSEIFGVSESIRYKNIVSVSAGFFVKF